MKETKKINKGIIIVIVLLILIILSLIGYIIYEKIESDKTEQNQNTTSSTTTTNNEKNNNLTEKFVTFYDLGMKEHENYSKVFNIVLNNEKYNMVITINLKI